MICEGWGGEEREERGEDGVGWEEVWADGVLWGFGTWSISWPIGRGGVFGVIDLQMVEHHGGS